MMLFYLWRLESLGLQAVLQGLCGSALAWLGQELAEGWERKERCPMCSSASWNTGEAFYNAS